MPISDLGIVCAMLGLSRSTLYRALSTAEIGTPFATRRAAEMGAGNFVRQSRVFATSGAGRPSKAEAQ
jgi:hypothetical protein